MGEGIKLTPANLPELWPDAAPSPFAEGARHGAGHGPVSPTRNPAVMRPNARLLLQQSAALATGLR